LRSRITYVFMKSSMVNWRCDRRRYFEIILALALKVEKASLSRNDCDLSGKSIAVEDSTCLTVTWKERVLNDRPGKSLAHYSGTHPSTWTAALVIVFGKQRGST
jgi:hypothetical protein